MRRRSFLGLLLSTTSAAAWGAGVSVPGVPRPIGGGGGAIQYPQSGGAGPPPPPASSVAPVVSGTTTVGSTLSCTQGTWTGSPTSYAYQWLRGGVNIPGATASTYLTVTADGGTSVGCMVTASNAGGSASATSNALAITAGGATSVWSAADAAANGMTLTNGGLTVVPTTSNVWQSIRTTTSKTSGKLYVEFLLTNLPAQQYISIGLADATFVPTNLLGTVTYSGGYGFFGSNVVSAGFTSNYAGAPPSNNPNDVFGMAVDFSSGGIWIADDNVWLNGSNPATGSLPIISFVPATVGALFPAMSLYAPNTGVWTLQPTPASQKYLPPPGFQAWDGGPVTPSTSVWSAADAAANGMTLSNGGLTVTVPSSGSRGTVRSTISRSSGKLYAEFATTGTISAYPVLFGLASSGFDPTATLGFSTYSGGAQPNLGDHVTAGFIDNVGTVNAQVTTNDVWGIAVDFSTGNVWLSENGVWTNSGNPATGTTPFMSFALATVGPLFLGLSINPTSTSGVWTLQPTAASQKYAPPAGFTPWG